MTSLPHGLFAAEKVVVLCHPSQSLITLLYHSQVEETAAMKCVYAVKMKMAISTAAENRLTASVNLLS